MPRRPKTAKADRAEVRVRLRTAQTYLDIAELVIGEQDRDEFVNVAVGLAVLAGIAVSDAISGSRLGQIHSGDNHRDAAELLMQATPDGNKLSKTFEGHCVLANDVARDCPLASASARTLLHAGCTLTLRAG